MDGWAGTLWGLKRVGSSSMAGSSMCQHTLFEVGEKRCGMHS